VINLISWLFSHAKNSITTKGDKDRNNWRARTCVFSCVCSRSRVKKSRERRRAPDANWNTKSIRFYCEYASEVHRAQRPREEETSSASALAELCLWRRGEKQLQSDLQYIIYALRLQLTQSELQTPLCLCAHRVPES
jgi:hypothetical protein